MICPPPELNSPILMCTMLKLTFLRGVRLHEIQNDQKLVLVDKGWEDKWQTHSEAMSSTRPLQRQTDTHMRILLCGKFSGTHFAWLPEWQLVELPIPES